jgi:hypothetical protein
MSPFTDAPIPDKLPLIKAGAHVKRLLDANPLAQRLDTDQADIWAVSDFLGLAHQQLGRCRSV